MAVVHDACIQIEEQYTVARGGGIAVSVDYFNLFLRSLPVSTRRTYVAINNESLKRRTVA